MNEKLAKTSIIIPAYGNLELTKKCVASIISMTSYPDFEIILIDNDSGEEFQDFPITQSFSCKLRQSNPDNVDHKYEKQHTENKNKRAEKSFNDVTVDFFYHGSNLPKKSQKNFPL